MSDFDVKEKRFEQDIEEYLTTYGGYQKGNPAAFNREKALDTGTFLSFIRTSQLKQWERFEKIYGADSERQLIDRFCREVKLVGLLKVLRQGFTDRGIKFRAVFWKPETSINETSQAQYAANILHCTRQLHYSLSTENSSLPDRTPPTPSSSISSTERARTPFLSSKTVCWSTSPWI